MKLSRKQVDEALAEQSDDKRVHDWQEHQEELDNLGDQDSYDHVMLGTDESEQGAYETMLDTFEFRMACPFS